MVYTKDLNNINVEEDSASILKKNTNLKLRKRISNIFIFCLLIFFVLTCLEYRDYNLICLPLILLGLLIAKNIPKLKKIIVGIVGISTRKIK